MSAESGSHLGKKILYGFVIALCVLVIILNTTGIIGVWVIRNPIINTVDQVLEVVVVTADSISESTVKVDQLAATFQEITIQVEDASTQIAQNVTDKGLLLTLLPEEKEQKLVDSAIAVGDTLQGIQASISSVLELYKSINSLPFVNLPAPDAEQIEKMESSVQQTKTMVETVRTSISDFRSGVTDKIDVVTSTASKLTSEIQSIRDKLSQLNEKMIALSEFATRIRNAFPGILTTIFVILTLLLAFVIYTQVEVIRLYVARWRLLK